MPSLNTQNDEYILHFSFFFECILFDPFIRHSFDNHVFKTVLYRHDPLHISFDPSSCYMTT